MLPSRRPFRPLLVLALLLGPAAPAPAADAWPVPRGPSREPSPYRFDPAAVKRLPRDYLEDAAACVLYSGNTHLVEPDGTVETITHEVTRLNGRKGVDKLGEFRSILYDPAYQKLTVNTARIHKRGGGTVEVQPRHLQLRDVGTDYQVYDREKQLIISFPSLEVGDVLEVKWTVRGKNPEHDGRFFTRYSFGDPTFPVAADELRVRLPKTMPFKYAAVAGRLVPVVTDEGGQRTYVWRGVNCDKLPLDENPPPKEELRLSVACSTFPSWEEVGRWKQRLRADCWQCTDDVRQVVREVTRGLTGPEAKARALTYWVRRNVRYVSAGEKHDYTPNAPGQVLANRFGDCKDTSQLLAVMLREAGIPVELATLGVLDDGQVLEAVPSPWGTHAILLSTIDGKPHWVDTTATLAGWDFLPREDRDRLCYLVDDRGALRLLRTPPLVPEGNKTEVTTEVWVGADGSSRCARTLVAHGSAAVGQRDTFLEVPAGERRRQVTAELQDANSRTRLVRLRVGEQALREFDLPVTVHTTFEVPGHFSGKPDLEGNLSDSKVWGKLLAYTLDYDRKVPFVFRQPFESVHRYVLHLPPALTLESTPHDKTVRSKWGSFTLRVKVPGGTDPVRDLELEFHTRLEKTRVEVEDFDPFRKFHDEVNSAYRVWLTLKPTRDLSDARLLEVVLAWVPEDSASAAVLARLYEHCRHLKSAQRVLKRALYYRPDDKDLLELAVQVAPTPKDEEAAQRELVRRHPGEARHEIALAAILVGQGKQTEARKLLTPLAEKGPPARRALAHFHLARSHYRKDELQAALKHLEESAKLDGETVNTVRAYMLKGKTLEELGRPADAARAYQQALLVDRESEAALDALIRLAVGVNNRAEALDYLRRYVLVVGDEPSGLLLAADYYYRLGRPDEAYDLALRARGQRRDEKAERLLGLVCLRRGDFKGAAGHLEKAEPDAAVLEGLLRADLVLGRVADLPGRLRRAEALAKKTDALLAACARARRLLQLRADLGKASPPPAGKEKEWAAALDSLASARLAQADRSSPELVQAFLTRALDKAPELGPALGLRGRLALERGKLTPALADAERAIAASPRDPAGYFVRGRVRSERNAPGALDDLQKAAELSGRQDADVLHALAAVLSRAGRAAEALEAQRQAVKLKPADTEMTEQLRALEKAAPEAGPVKPEGAAPQFGAAPSVVSAPNPRSLLLDAQ
jgi:tetratricopeptide (TPR) repeat protein